MKFNKQLVQLDHLLEKFRSDTNPRNFYLGLRSSDIPFVPCSNSDAKDLIQCYSGVLHKIGNVSIGLGVGFLMHAYLLSAISTFPLRFGSKQYFARNILLNRIKNSKSIIANTGGVRTFDRTKKAVIEATDGGYFINGETDFMSLANLADVMIFSLSLNNKWIVCMVSLKDQDSIKRNSLTFGDKLAHSNTSKVEFNNLFVEEKDTFLIDSGVDEKNSPHFIYQRIWFQSLIGAVYLGATERVLNQLRLFSASSKKNGTILKDLDGFKADLGRLIIEYKKALGLTQHMIYKFENLKKINSQSIEELFEFSCLAKQVNTVTSKKIVDSCVELMGTSSMRGDQSIVDIIEEIHFGILQPMTNIDMNRLFGDRFLKKEAL